jgi:hypothetical protein
MARARPVAFVIVEAPKQRDNPIGREAGLWVLAGCGVRLIFFFVTPQVIDSADSILYLEAAQKIADGRFTELYPRIPLLYPALAAIASFAAPDIETAAIVVSLVAGTLLVAPVFLLANGLHGREAARMSALMLVLWPWQVDYACRVAPEALYTLLWFVSVPLGIAAARKGGRPAWALPFLLFALYLSRPEGILIVGVIVFAGLIAGNDKKTGALRLLPSVTILILAIPLHLWLMHRLSVIAGVPPRLSASSMSFSFVARGGETLRTTIHLLAITLPVMLGPLLGLLALIGILAKTTFARDRRSEAALAIVAAAQFVAAALSTYAEPRYVMATLIAITLWSGRGAAVVARRAGASPRWSALRKAPAVLIVLMMIAGLVPNIVPPLLGRMSYKPLEYKIAGRWMNANLEPGLILSRKPQVGYYANMPTSGPAPEDTLEDIRWRIMDAGMRYAVVDERYSTQMVPALLPLLDPTNAPPWLRVLKADLSPYREARIVVYEVVKDALSP